MHRHQLMIHTFQALVWLDESLRERLQKRGWPKVNRSQALVMLNFAHGVTRPSDIAERLGISRQAVYTTIGQMEVLKLVTLSVDPEDARHRQLELTEFGAKMGADARSCMDEIVAELEQKIGRETFKHFFHALEADWGSASETAQRA